MVRINRRLANRQNFERIRKAYDNYQFWDGLVVEPQEALTPIVGNFYATPSDPADPFDCDRWPDSPYCGGSPLNEVPVGIDLNIVKDECTLGVQAAGTFGFIKLPPIQIAYRSPSCIPDNFVIPPPVNENSPPFIPPPTGSGIYVMLSSGFYNFNQANNNGTQYDRRWNTWSYEQPNIIYPSDIRNGNYNYLRLEVVRRNSFRMETNYIGNVDLIEQTVTLNLDIPIATDSYQFFDYNSSAPLRNQVIALYAGMNYVKATIIANSETGRNKNYYNFNDRGFGDFTEIDYSYTWQVYEANAETLKYPPPPPEFNKKMNCCPQNTQLLRLILKKIGSEDLPATVPTLLTKSDSGTTSINNLSQFISYTVKQLDALCGKYPIDIEIEDSDLTEEGNQTQQLAIPNIAEALGEIVTLLLVLRSESDANLSATIRAMIEAGAAKQAATLATQYGAANAEFLGYKGKQTSENLAMAFDPREERLDRILKEVEIPFKGWDNDDKADFNDQIAPLLEMAAMFKAQNFRNLGADDPSGKLRALLRNSGNFASKIDEFIADPPPPTNHNPEQPLPTPPRNEWDIFTEEAEQGFINQPGITDATHPYGKDFNRRPRIREIGTDTSDP